MTTLILWLETDITYGIEITVDLYKLSYSDQMQFFLL